MLWTLRYLSWYSKVKLTCNGIWESNKNQFIVQCTIQISKHSLEIYQLFFVRDSESIVYLLGLSNSVPRFTGRITEIQSADSICVAIYVHFYFPPEQSTSRRWVYWKHYIQKRQKNSASFQCHTINPKNSFMTLSQFYLSLNHINFFQIIQIRIS